MKLWPADWSMRWARGAVGSSLKLALSVIVIVALIVIQFIWPRIFVDTEVILGAILIFALFSMRGLYKRLESRPESS